MKTPSAWWGSRKSSTKSKEQQKEKSSSEQKNKQSTSPHGNNKHDLSKSSIRNDKIEKETNKPRSFDEPALSSSRNSPRTSKDLTSGGSGRGGGVVGGSGSSGFSGFDSERGHPLPRPSVSSATSLGIDLGAGLGSGSVSVSSVSSSGSSEDQNQIDQTQFGMFRGLNEMKLSPRARSPAALSPRARSPAALSPRTRSPGPGSRVTTAATSPRHPRYFGNSMESSTGRLDEGKSEFHPLPLPPGSPTSPPSLPTSTRACTVTESTHSYASKWKKGKLLGRGTFGHVYLGFNSDGGHMCAIKEVKVIADDQSSKECLKQLNQEITLLSQLSYPNIVQYYGSELCEETLSVYLEYVSGGSIHKLLQEYGAFREPVIRNYTKQILAGLAYLHGRNTVHRDIKGANILVDPNGEIKLADFGMAKHITACSSMLSFKGSPYWMAPEVVMNTNGYNLQVDIWSLGCTILEMATSKPPWSKYEGVAAIFKIGNSKDIPEIPDHLSADAKSFIKLCLQREPSARPTALQLLDHPFVRDLSTSRSGNINLNKEAFPHTYDGSRTPTALDIRSSRTNTSSVDALLTPSRVIGSPRENARMIASLPVSPCSSPLRHSGPSYPSYFQSPPHPSYTLAGGGQNGYNLNNYSLSPARTNPKYSLDLWREVPQFKAQTPPGGSPRIRRVELGL